MTAQVIFEGDNRTRRAFGQIDQSLSKMGRSVTGLSSSLRGFVGILAGGALARFLGNANKSADSMAKLRDRLGVTTEFLSEMEFAAEKSGVAFNTFATGLQRTQRRVAEAAKGMGEARGAIAELGLDAEKLAALPLEDQFTVLAERLSKVANEGDRTRLAFKLFDTEGVALLQLFKDGAIGIEEMRAEAAALGLTLTDDMANAAAASADAITEMEARFDAVARQAVTSWGPTFVALADFVANDMALAFNLSAGKIAEWAGALAGSFGRAAAKLVEWGEVLESVFFFTNDTFSSALDSLRDFARTNLEFSADAHRTAAEYFAFAFSIEQVGVAADATKKKVEGLVGAADDTSVTRDAATGLVTTVEDIAGPGIEDVVEDAIRGGAKNGSIGMAEALLDTIRNNFIQEAAQLIAGAFGGLFSGGGFLGSLFGITSRAQGGGVSAGQLVNTHGLGDGSEIFVPSVTGTVLRNQGGGGGGTTVVNVDARGSTMSPAEMRQTVQGAVELAVAKSRDVARRPR